MPFTWMQSQTVFRIWLTRRSRALRCPSLRINPFGPELSGSRASESAIMMLSFFGPVSNLISFISVENRIRQHWINGAKIVASSKYIQPNLNKVITVLIHTWRIIWKAYWVNSLSQMYFLRAKEPRTTRQLCMMLPGTELHAWFYSESALWRNHTGSVWWPV